METPTKCDKRATIFSIKIELLMSMTIIGLARTRVWHKILQISFTETKRFFDRNNQKFPVCLRYLFAILLLE